MGGPTKPEVTMTISQGHERVEIDVGAIIYEESIAMGHYINGRRMTIAVCEEVLITALAYMVATHSSSKQEARQWVKQISRNLKDEVLEQMDFHMAEAVNEAATASKQ